MFAMYRALKTVLLALILCGSGVVANAAEPGEVTYIASEALYINAGTDQGLNLGDTLTIVTAHPAGDTAALVVVTQIASRSAACRVVTEFVTLKPGFIALLPDRPNAGAQTAALEKLETSATTSEAPASERNRLSGSVYVGAFWRNDLEASSYDYVQPELGTRVRVDHLGGSDLTLKLDMRSRYRRHSASSVGFYSEDRWNHRLAELSLTYQEAESPNAWGVGRVFASEMRGMGYIDGAYYSRRLSTSVSAGVAAGMVPSVLNSALRTERKKAGAFVSYRSAPHSATYTQLSAALSSEYESGVTSRDFLYLQATVRRENALSLMQSMEIDWNRGWRFDRTGKRFRLTNYFGSVEVTPARYISAQVSLDARKDVLRYINSELPDSLFDDQIRKSLRGALRVRITRNFRFWSSAGIRFRESSLSDTRFLRIGFNVRRFPVRTHSVSASLTLLESEFSSGYRPRVDYRLALGNRTRLRLSGGGSFTSTGGRTSDEVFFELGAVQRFGVRYWLDTSVRRYFSDYRDSVELFARLSASIGG